MRPIIHSLEAAYSRLIFDVLPVVRSPAREFIPPKLALLDATAASGAKLRTVLGPVPSRVTDPDNVRGMVAEILDGVLADILASAEGPPDISLLREAVVTVRHHLAQDGIESDVLAWALPPSEQPLESTVVHQLLLDEARSGHSVGAHEIDGYVTKVLALEDAEQGFITLVGELLACTRDLAPEQITVAQLELIQVRALPFCALGVLRGVAMWFLLDREELDVTRSDETRLLVETLGTMQSTAVIDVFTAYFMSNVAKLTTLADAGGSRAVIQEALNYLYPNLGLELSTDADSPFPADDALHLSVVLHQEDVQRFLGFTAARWTLVYPRPAAPDFYHRAPPERAYHRLVEVKLQDIAIKATSEMDLQYGRLLGVFGHHSGSLFKASGAFHIWAACNRGETPTRHETKHMLDKLLPVWGISQAISLIQKVDEESGLTVPESWIDRKWLESPELGNQASVAINQLVRYVYDNATNDPPAMPWIICSHHDTLQNIGWNDDPDHRTSTLHTLPPFLDDPIIYDKTLALTIGLFEMVNNARKYPPMRGWGRSVRKALDKLPHWEQVVAVNIKELPGEIAVILEQPLLMGVDGAIPSSRSLDRIRIFEYQCLRGLVATGELEQCGTTSNPHIVRARQRWTFRWGELLTVLRRTEHGS